MSESSCLVIGKVDKIVIYCQKENSHLANKFVLSFTIKNSENIDLSSHKMGFLNICK